MVASVRVGHERLRPVCRPLHGAADLLRGPRADGFFGVDEDLGAESATDVGGHHPEFVLRRDGTECRQHQARHVRVLTGGVKREAVARRIVLADRRAWLDRVRDEPVVDDLERRDVRGALDRLVDGRGVAQFPVVAHVAGNVVVDLRRPVRIGLVGIDIGGQDAVVDLDQLCGIARLRERIRDHDGHVIAYVIDFALGQSRVGRRFHVLAVLVGDHPAADQAADAVGRQIVPGEDADDARCLGGPRRVDLLDPGVGVRRADESRVRLSGPVDVVYVVAASPEKPRIFLAERARADSILRHVSLPLPGRRR